MPVQGRWSQNYTHLGFSFSLFFVFSFVSSFSLSRCLTITTCSNFNQVPLPPSWWCLSVLISRTSIPFHSTEEVDDDDEESYGIILLSTPTCTSWYICNSLFFFFRYLGIMRSNDLNRSLLKKTMICWYDMYDKKQL